MSPSHDADENRSPSLRWRKRRRRGASLSGTRWATEDSPSRSVPLACWCVERPDLILPGAFMSPFSRACTGEQASDSAPDAEAVRAPAQRGLPSAEAEAHRRQPRPVRAAGAAPPDAPVPAKPALQGARHGIGTRRLNPLLSPFHVPSLGAPPARRGGGGRRAAEGAPRHLLGEGGEGGGGEREQKRPRARDPSLNGRPRR